MIIDFSLSYKGYGRILDNYNGWDYQCPNPECSARGRFARHASYYRYLVIWDGEGVKDEILEILRLRCCSCGTTHAILPYEAIPFWQYSLQTVILLLYMAFADNMHQTITKTAEETGITYQTLYRFLDVFCGYLARLSLLFRDMSLWTLSESPSDMDLARLSLCKDPPFPQEEFFRRNRTPLMLHRRNTDAYRFFTGGCLTTEKHDHIAPAFQDAFRAGIMDP